MNFDHISFGMNYNLIDGKFPVVSGDVVNSNRPLTGPYQHTKIVIGSNIN